MVCGSCFVMTWEGCLTSRGPAGAGVPTAAPPECSVLAAWVSAPCAACLFCIRV